MRNKILKALDSYTGWVYERAGGSEHKYIASTAEKMSVFGPVALACLPITPYGAAGLILGGLTIGLLDADRKVRFEKTVTEADRVLREIQEFRVSWK